jgi:4-hydroxybenzoyl-CoA reductase subunit beta
VSALPDLEVRRAATLAQAVGWLAGTPGARAIAGGTDLVPNLRRGLGAPPLLVDLAGVPGFDRLAFSHDGVAIGAGVTLATLASDARVLVALPAIAQAAAAVAGPAHRSAATIGGNLCADTRCLFYNQSEWWRASNQYCLKHGGTTCHVAPQGQHCHAAYSADVAPALIACGATVEVAGPQGTRVLAVEHLYRDDGRAHLALAPGELVTSVRVPPQPLGSRSAYRKARVRGGVDFPLAGVAARVAIEGGRIGVLDLALTGTDTRPRRIDVSALVGSAVDDKSLAAVATAVRKAVTPMRTTSIDANWRRQVAAVLAQRLVGELAASA